MGHAASLARLPASGAVSPFRSMRLLERVTIPGTVPQADAGG